MIDSKFILISLIYVLAATCLTVTELGPCYSALQYESQVEAAEGKSETCKKYLEEVLSKCAQKNVSQGIDSCKQHCSKDSLFTKTESFK